MPQPDCIVRIRAIMHACICNFYFFLFYSNSLKTNEKILSRRLIDGKNFNKSARTIFLSKYVFPRKCEKRKPETRSRTFQFFLSQQVFLQVSLSCSLYWSGSALTPTHKQELDHPHYIMDNSISNGYLRWIFYHNHNYKQEVTRQQALICFQTLAAP